ncbi:DNA glycosylase [Mannheimia sp. AT1]|uniref:DNA glycosylase n=1 Tax=Mannheimia cairinae TaxID=3025936 RepID=A0ABT5MV61_9PAST|nr:DNA glycosylase [Mannheimia cairinae]MDD0824797.1 DNA glycosylase [Mannheimia cairinae]MDD0826273.1 DNA glycosylase [Mannheimia cairinae]
MEQQILEHHPFPPILPENATVVMIGTFPPTSEKRCMEFHYPNYQNDMWRIMGSVFYDDADYFQVDNEKRFDPIRIEAFLRDKGIALCSSAKTAIRLKGNASDKDLKIVDPIDMDELLTQLPKIKWLFTTGGLATETLLNLLPEKIKAPKTNEWIEFPYTKARELFLYRLPSTSRAYPLSLAKKTDAYRQFFIKAGLINEI